MAGRRPVSSPIGPAGNPPPVPPLVPLARTAGGGSRPRELARSPAGALDVHSIRGRAEGRWRAWCAGRPPVGAGDAVARPTACPRAAHACSAGGHDAPFGARDRSDPAPAPVHQPLGGRPRPRRHRHLCAGARIAARQPAGQALRPRRRPDPPPDDRRRDPPDLALGLGLDADRSRARIATGSAARPAVTSPTSTRASSSRRSRSPTLARSS